MMGHPKSRPVHRAEQLPPAWLAWGLALAAAAWIVGVVLYVFN